MVFLALWIAAVTAPRYAHALGPVDVEIALKLGAATNPSAANPSALSGTVNPLGPGPGVRTGVAFLGGFYVGGSFMDYLGGSATTSTPYTGGTFYGATTNPVISESGSISTLKYGAELGYGIKLEMVTLRPQVGLGNAIFKTTAGSYSQSVDYGYLEPGVTGFVTLGLLLLGADMNVLLFPGLQNNQVAASVHAQIGVKF